MRAIFALCVIFATSSAQAITFEERVAAQTAIEQVSWSHRIWPADNPGPKPALTAVMPDEAIRAKVETYLRQSEALERFWQRPITASQLQAELDRIVKSTRDPGMLRELFAALGDDASLIAETLVRQTLPERLLRHWYAAEERSQERRSRRPEAAIHEAASGASVPATLAPRDAGFHRAKPPRATARTSSPREAARAT